MSAPGKSRSSDITLFTSNSMHGVLRELVPEFERASGNRLSISYDPAQVMLQRIAAGESADVAILGQAAIDALAGNGKVKADSRRTLARCGVGVGVLTGATRPDIATVESLKRALLAAKSIAYTTSGASGIHFAGIIERLGIGAEVRAKAVTRPGGLIGELAASGEAEMAVQQIPELIAVPGIDLVGPLPQELQQVSVACIGLFADSKHADAGQALVDFLTDPAAARTFKAKGFEPA